MRKPSGEVFNELNAKTRGGLALSPTNAYTVQKIAFPRLVFFSSPITLKLLEAGLIQCQSL
jgi:hypothetical protein